MFVLNLIQLIGASLGIVLLQGEMVSLEENAAHIFKPVAQVGVAAGESAAGELNFAPIDPQHGMEQLKHKSSYGFGIITQRRQRFDRIKLNFHHETA